VRYRWVILAVGTAAQASTSAFFQGLPAVAPTLRGDYGLSLAETGVALSSVNAGMVLTLLAWGVLADRIGEHRVIPLGLVGSAVAAALASATGEFGPLLACLFVGGLFVSSANAASGRAVMSWFERRERGMALGIRQASLPLGGAVAAAALPAIAAGGGMDSVFVALAALLAAAALASLVWLRPAPHEHDHADEGAPADRPSPMRDPQVWRLSLAGGCLAFVQFGFVGFLVLFLHDVRGFSIAAAAASLVAMQLAGAGLRIVVGRWSDRRGSRLGPLRRICVALALACGALALVEPLGDGVLLPVLLLAAFIAVSWNGLSFTAAAELARRGESGTALGLQNTVLAVSATACLASFGALVEWTSWRAGYALLALLPVLALVLLAGMGERVQQQ
jgi:sugar phosphate permease